MYLTWDLICPEQHKETVVIRNGDQVLFSEPASWEAIGDPGRPNSRYQGICKILKQKYGERVHDLEPTDASEMWLYGDKLSGPTLRALIHDEVFGSPKE